MNPVYSQTGSYIAIAGLIVMILNHFGINVVQTDIEDIIGAVITIIGIVKQYLSHKNLAITTGSYYR